ncbi:MAG TPA: FHA domain-containing protein, partial [Roseiflexaceae bacterium]|nr:FHA domain-containing protein [Roseiflexaceae bacterium]
LLNFAAGAAPLVELLLLRPNAVFVGAIRAYPGPIEVTPEGRWIDLTTGAAIRDERGRSPLQVVRAQREAVRALLQQEAGRLLDSSTGSEAEQLLFDRIVGALICAPTTHPESRISLDVDDHRQQLKILGLDELAGLAAMLRTGALLSEAVMRRIVAELFEGRLWLDGERLLFELAPGRFQLRVFGDDSRPESVATLMEGENIAGRRRSAQRYERRITLSGDDLISSDHARLLCGDGDHVTLRDTSKNGTWVTPPGGAEERLHGMERAITLGAMLRMGTTRMRLERIGEN